MAKKSRKNLKSASKGAEKNVNLNPASKKGEAKEAPSKETLLKCLRGQASVLRPELEELKGMARELRLAGTARSWSRYRDVREVPRTMRDGIKRLWAAEKHLRSHGWVAPDSLVECAYSAVFGREAYVAKGRSRAIDTRVREGLAIYVAQAEEGQPRRAVALQPSAGFYASETYTPVWVKEVVEADSTPAQMVEAKAFTLAVFGGPLSLVEYAPSSKDRVELVQTEEDIEALIQRRRKAAAEARAALQRARTLHGAGKATAEEVAGAEEDFALYSGKASEPELRRLRREVAEARAGLSWPVDDGDAREVWVRPAYPDLLEAQLSLQPAPPWVESHAAKLEDAGSIREAALLRAFVFDEPLVVKALEEAGLEIPEYSTRPTRVKVGDILSHPALVAWACQGHPAAQRAVEAGRVMRSLLMLDEQGEPRWPEAGEGLATPLGSYMAERSFQLGRSGKDSFDPFRGFEEGKGLVATQLKALQEAARSAPEEVRDGEPLFQWEAEAYEYGAELLLTVCEEVEKDLKEAHEAGRIAAEDAAREEAHAKAEAEAKAKAKAEAKAEAEKISAERLSSWAESPEGKAALRCGGHAARSFRTAMKRKDRVTAAMMKRQMVSEAAARAAAAAEAARLAADETAAAEAAEAAAKAAAEAARQPKAVIARLRALPFSRDVEAMRKVRSLRKAVEAGEEGALKAALAHLEKAEA